MQRLYAAPAFERTRAIAAVYDTDPAVVAEILPPPLRPTDRPRVSLSVAYIGASNALQPFGACTLAVECRYGEETGAYPITMPMSTDSAVIFGRELYGEPKKVADIQVHHDGRVVVGTVTRHGLTYVELRGEVQDEERAEAARASTQFFFKFMPAPDGNGFDNDPVLVRVRHSGVSRLVQGLDGEVILRESPHDPVVDLPVRNLLSLTYSEGDTYTHGEILARVPGESFLPYMFGRVDDLELLARAAAQSTA